jgi:hypothetical protein
MSLPVSLHCGHWGLKRETDGNGCTKTGEERTRETSPHGAALRIIKSALGHTVHYNTRHDTDALSNQAGPSGTNQRVHEKAA